MKFIISFLLVLFLFLSLGCKKKDIKKEVIFFLQSEESELVSDYNYYLGKIQDYYSDKNIQIREINKRVIEIEGNEIIIKKDTEFAMVLNNNGKYKIQYIFGTDVDMMMEINEFF